MQTTVPVTAGMTVNETVQRYPNTLPHFTALGIDTCCGGAKPIAEAARRHGADAEQLLARLNEAALASR